MSFVDRDCSESMLTKSSVGTGKDGKRVFSETVDTLTPAVGAKEGIP